MLLFELLFLALEGTFQRIAHVTMLHPNYSSTLCIHLGHYVYELIHVYVVTLSLSDSVVNFEFIE